MISIIIPTWNNIQYLVQTIRSLRERTEGVDYRLIVVPNGCTDGTHQWLKKEGITQVSFGNAVGFVKATNAGLTQVKPGEDVLFLNDDVRVTDPYWLERLQARLIGDVGAVGPVSNFVMGTQDFRLDKLPMVHEAPFLIGYCMLISAAAFSACPRLDERYGLGTNDDLDYSLELRAAGFKLLVDRSVFLFHYGARSIMRVADYDELQTATRATLKEKWGEEVCAKMLNEMRAIVARSKSPQEQPA